MTFHLMFRNLSGLHCCLFVKVLLPLSSNLFILAQVVCFVNNFFELFSSSFCLTFLSRNVSAEGGIWTLAPLLTTCTLSRGVPSASWVLLHSLNHSSYLINDINTVTERVGFEPTRPFGQTVFKTASLWPLRYLSSNVLAHYIREVFVCQEFFIFHNFLKNSFIFSLFNEW